LLQPPRPEPFLARGVGVFHAARSVARKLLMATVNNGSSVAL